MRALTITASILALTVIAAAQPPDTLWTRTYGGRNSDYGSSVQQTLDGGYIIAGSTYSFGIGSVDAYLVKTDALGDLTWQTTFGASNGDYGSSVKQTSDGGYIIAGSTDSYGVGGDVYLVKANAAGNLIWQHNFGGVGWDQGFSVQQTIDGGYVITGSTYSFGSSLLSNVYLIKVNAYGNLVWQHGLGGNSYDVGYSVQQITDGGYIIAGSTQSFGAGYDDVYLIKTDASGNLTWQHTFGGSLLDYGYSVQQTPDGGYIIVGKTLSFGAGGYDVYLVKTDASGNLIWQHTYGGSDNDEGNSVQQTADGGYIIAGSTQSFGAGNDDLYLIKTGSEGNLVWQYTFGGSEADYGHSIQQTSDGGYIISGNTYSYGEGFADVYLIKTEAEATPNVIVDLIPTTIPIQIPAPGGNFNFDIVATNEGSFSAVVTLWSKQILPDNTLMEPLLGPVTVTLPPGISTWFRTQDVPASAPPGEYKYIGCAGIYPNTIWASDTLIYTKLTTGEGPVIGDWACTGEPFPGEQSQTASIPSGLDLGISPNPFNPSTALSYELRAASYVSLQVYDTAGRLVKTLVEGTQEAGTHSATFDGSELTSGVYLVKLTAGNQTEVQKVVLMK